MAKSLADLIGRALDASVAGVDATAFQRVRAGDGMSLRRWFREGGGIQCEICVYRDKWWTKSGGRISADVFVLHDGYQMAACGTPQSWLDPDYSRPLRHFQYSLSSEAAPFVVDVHAATELDTVASAFAKWLEDHALPWLADLGREDGVLDHLRRQRALSHEAVFAMHLGRGPRAAEALAAYLETLPRNCDAELQRLENAGLLGVDEVAELAFASMQREEEYRAAVATWRSRRSGSQPRP